MERFVRIGLSIPDRDLCDILIAEVFSAGAIGLEERDKAGLLLWVYVPMSELESVKKLLSKFCIKGILVGPSELVPQVNWESRMRAGFKPVTVGDELKIQPSWMPIMREDKTEIVVIDPGQAFGIGSHPSTKNMLRLLVRIKLKIQRVDLLDVGCGTGILALAALRLGARRAVAFDCDPLAAEATRNNSILNKLSDRLGCFCGTVEALECVKFSLLMANMLRRELSSVLPSLASYLKEDGYLVISGILVQELEDIETLLRTLSLKIVDSCEESDPNGDSWLGLLVTS